jgi:hypothetical protein
MHLSSKRVVAEREHSGDKIFIVICHHRSRSGEMTNVTALGNFSRPPGWGAFLGILRRRPLATCHPF